MKLGVLCSGQLGFEVLVKCHQDYHIAFVATDKNSLSIAEFCAEKNIPLFRGNPREGKLHAFAKAYQIEILISINYLFLIEKDVIDLPSDFAFNIHGSLLPKYRGRTPHVWAIINGEKYCGITAHLIDQGCDTGDILLQQKIEIGSEETGAGILKRYAKAYYPLIKRVLDQHLNKTLTPVAQNNEKATYFGKRSPEDGEINWNWSKERIYNWVRAQSDPYPGAFFYWKEQKVIVDKVEYSDHGFHQNDPNGKILSIKEGIPIVKTPNGAIKLIRIRNQEQHNFEINGQLSS